MSAQHFTVTKNNRLILKHYINKCISATKYIWNKRWSV